MCVRASPLCVFGPLYFEFNAVHLPHRSFSYRRLVHKLLWSPFPMTCVVCMRARCVYAIVYAMPVDPRALLFHLFLSSLLPLLPLYRGSKQVIEFLKVNFSCTAVGSEYEIPLCVKWQTASSYIYMYQSTWISFHLVSNVLTALLLNCTRFWVTTIISFIMCSYLFLNACGQKLYRLLKKLSFFSKE